MTGLGGYSHPAVREAAVVGPPHPVYGEVPVAKYKELPKNSVGKVEKPGLRRRFTLSAN